MPLLCSLSYYVSVCRMSPRTREHMRVGLKGFAPDELEPRTSDGELVADLLATAGAQFESGSCCSFSSSSGRSTRKGDSAILDCAGAGLDTDAGVGTGMGMGAGTGWSPPAAAAPRYARAGLELEQQRQLSAT